jgi:hypothetical protein
MPLASGPRMFSEYRRGGAVDDARTLGRRLQLAQRVRPVPVSHRLVGKSPEGSWQPGGDLNCGSLAPEIAHVSSSDERDTKNLFGYIFWVLGAEECDGC